MTMFTNLKSLLQKAAAEARPPKAVFFKSGKGHYAEHDQFINVSVPELRKIAKQFNEFPIKDLQHLLESPINEERFIALLILVKQYKIGTTQDKERIYQFYLKNMKYVNNWNLVDLSCRDIIGAHLLHKDKNILLSLAASKILWERRIAIVSTWEFIRNNQFEWTIIIAEILLNDAQDLIHKAVGWMLREMGERNMAVLKEFLDKHAKQMPRTMLRYAIEKFPEKDRKAFLVRS